LTKYNAPLPAPDDLAEQAKTASSKVGLGAHYGVSEKTVTRWLSEVGLVVDWKERSRLSKIIPRPDDFESRVPEHSTIRSLGRHYDVSDKTINRWLQETGLDIEKGLWTPKFDRGTILTALRFGKTQQGACRFLRCSTPYFLDCARYHGLDVEDLLSRHEEITYLLTVDAASVPDESLSPHTVLRGAAGVVQSAINDWSRAMQIPVSEAGQCLPFDQGLLEEEIGELWEAIQSESRVDQLDALADIVYTCFNIAYRRNLPLSLALGEVHRSNSTKSPNGEGKPTKGEGYDPPDLVEVLRHWDAVQGEK